MSAIKFPALLLATALMLPVVVSCGSSKPATSHSVAKNELNEKATKSARDAAKDYKRDDWEVAPGALPMEKQLDRSYIMQMEVDEEYQPKFIMAEAMSIGESYDGAKMQALELAKQNLAGQIETQLAAIIENSVSNSQLGKGEAATIVETITASKSMITQKLGRTVPVVELYRTLKNKNKEVLVRIAYSSDSAMQAAKSVVKDELKKRGEELHGQLDNALGF